MIPVSLNQGPVRISKGRISKGRLEMSPSHTHDEDQRGEAGEFFH